MANQISKLAVGIGILATSGAAMAADKPNILVFMQHCLNKLFSIESKTSLDIVE